MMDVRKKLVELLNEVQETGVNEIPAGFGCTREYIANEKVASHLTDHGVTVQEWISVDDKYPPYNRDVLVYRPNMAMKIIVDTYDGYYGDDDDEWYEGWALYGKDTHGNPAITHWSYLPQPPKGE